MIRTTSVRRVIAVSVVAALVSTACSSRSSSTSAPPEATIDIRHPYAGIAAPLDDLITSRVGYSESQISGALLDEKGALVRTCMLSSGWQALPSEIPSHTIQDEPSRPFGAVVAATLSSFDAAPDARSPQPVAATDARRAEALQSCFEQARGLPNPMAPFLAWLDHFESELSGGIESQHEVIGAAAAARACFSRLGYPGQDEVTISNDLAGRAAALVASFESAARTRQDVLSALTQLSDHERTLTPGVLACVYVRERARARARADLERRFIEVHGAALEEQLRSVAQSLRHLQPMLNDQPSGTGTV